MDAGGLFTEAAFAVTVTDVNDKPGELMMSNDTVGEGMPVGTPVGVLSGEDQDGDPLTFSLVPGCGSEGNAAFTIDGNTLRTATVFDAAVQDRYWIRVRVADPGGLWREG